MLVIKVELWPHGVETAARELARGYIINDLTAKDRLRREVQISVGASPRLGVPFPESKPSGWTLGSP